MLNLTAWQEMLAHLALKGLAILLLSLLLGLLLGRLSAARRYVLWTAASAMLVALPLALLFLPAWHVLPALPVSEVYPEAGQPEEVPAERVTPRRRVNAITPAEDPSASAVTAAPAAAPVAGSAPVKDVAAGPDFSWKSLLPALPFLWLGLTVIFFARIGLSAWRLRRLDKDCITISPAPFTAVANELGLRRLPTFLVGPATAVPMVWGIFRPRLLLPEGYEDWPPNQLRSVLIHELSHLKRRDPAALLFAQVMHALHACNPLAWLFLRRLRADQERACDDTVLRHGIRPSDYAQHLLDLSRHTRLALGPGLCALAMANLAPIEARVSAILDCRCRREPASRRWCVGLLALTFLIAVPLAMLHALEGPKLRGRILDRNGVVLAETTADITRRYPLKALTTHVVGYVIQPVDRRNTAQPLAGVAALEKQADAQLNAGADVRLTLDARIQQIAHRAVREAGFSRAAVVVMDPRNGGVLAVASLPTYDPNAFIPRLTIKSWEALVANTEYPLLDRTLRGSYPPGAAFMPVTALAAISAGKADSIFECTGTVTYGKKRMRCWINEKDGAHGLLDMRAALVRSCNCYWYQMANDVGFRGIIDMGRRLGFGTPTGILPGETAGILPDPEGQARHTGTAKWDAGYTANLAIGQGTVTVSPLQMAIAAATIANGGKIAKPTLLQTDGSPAWAVDLVKEGLPADQIEVLRRALWEKVNVDFGAGMRARSDRYAIAGTTGTTQNWRRVGEQRISENDGWFIGFAPYDKPTLAFAIFVQGAKSGGASCAPIAKRIVEETLDLPADGSGTVDPVEDPTAAIEDSARLREAEQVWLEKAKTLQPPALTPNESGPPQPGIDPAHEKRWRYLQSTADLHELPQGAHDVQSKLEGESLPRTSTLSFRAPRSAVRAWLGTSPGYWRYQRAMGQMPRPLVAVGNESSISQAAMFGLTALKASDLDFTQGPADPAYIPAWPTTGGIGTFQCSSPRGTLGSVTLENAGDDLVAVKIQAQALWRTIMIAD